MDDREARERVAYVEQLLGRIPEDPAYTEALQGLVDLYGEALRRIAQRFPPEQIVEDELLSHLLLVHDLHPLDVETRVRGALEEVRPYLGSHGGDVELLGVEDAVVRLRLGGSCDGCPSSSATLKLAIEDAIARAAPEVERVEAEGATEPEPKLLQLGRVERPAAEDGGTSWTVVGALRQLPADGTLAKSVDGVTLRFVRVDGAFYAYRDLCPGCSEPLGDAALEGAELHCGECGRRYDARRAGRCLDEPELYLEPVPLLEEDGLVRVALPAGVP